MGPSKVQVVQVVQKNVSTSSISEHLLSTSTNAFSWEVLKSKLVTGAVCNWHTC